MVFYERPQTVLVRRHKKFGLVCRRNVVAMPDKRPAWVSIFLPLLGKNRNIRTNPTNSPVPGLLVGPTKQFVGHYTYEESFPPLLFGVQEKTRLAKLVKKVLSWEGTPPEGSKAGNLSAVGNRMVPTQDERWFFRLFPTKEGRKRNLAVVWGPGKAVYRDTM